MNLSIIGTGYVGLTTGTCFAEVGHHVTCVDNDPQKIDTLLAGDIPIYEPGLADLVKKNVAAGRLKFTTSTAEGVRDGEVVFIAVPTPPQPDGSVDLCFIEKVAREIAESLTPDLGYRVIVDKSTVPVRTGEKVAETVRRYAPDGVEFGVASNPEFLREGSAVQDLLEPDRIVFGSNDDRALAMMHQDLRPLRRPGPRHRHRLRRTHQARRQFLPGAEDLLHQCRVRDLRASGGRRREGRRGHRHGCTHRPAVPECRPRLRRFLFPQGHEGLHRHLRNPRHPLRTAQGGRAHQQRPDSTASSTRSAKSSGS
jgi:hypothetical protein